MISGPLSLQSGVKTPTKLPGFEDHHVLCVMEVLETKAVTAGTITLGRNKEKHTGSLAAISTAIKRQVHVAASLSSKAVQPLPHTVHKDEVRLDTAVPEARVQPRRNNRSALAALSDAMKGVCSVYDTDSRQLTKAHEMETEHGLFGNVYLVHTDPPYKMLNKA